MADTKTEKTETKKDKAVNEYAQTQEQYDAAHSPEPDFSKAETPDTASGLGLKAAEGKDGEEASEAYHAAKKQARWG